MKKIVLFLLTCLSLATLEAEDKQSVDPTLSTYRTGPQDGYSWRQRKVIYNINDATLTKDKLLSTRWVYDPEIPGDYVLVFYRDDVFFVGSYTGGVLLEGKYRISQNKVELYDFKKNLDGKILEFDGTMTKLGFARKSDNLYYSDFLTGSRMSFFAVGSEKRNGDSAIYAGVKVVSDNRFVVANDTVKLRLTPSRTGKQYQFSLYDYSVQVRKGLFLKGTVVTQLARTVDSETIDGITSPWLLLRIDFEEGSTVGWAFGGYFTRYDDSMKNEYRKILDNEMSKEKAPS